MSNRVVHFEIPYDDSSRASEFYKEVFDWSIQPMQEMDYTMVTTGPVNEQGMSTEPGYINGGMFKREEPLGPPMLTIDVADIEKTLEKIASQNGTTVVEKQPVGDMGFIAYFKDSEGNLVGLWQNA